MHRLFTGLCALALGSASLAQVITTSTLNGVVVNEQGAPISGAAVTVVYEPTAATYTTTSRGDGSFAVRGLRPGGPYTVRAKAAGFAETETRQINLVIDQGADVSVQLRAEQTITLDKFEVTATPADALYDPNRTGTGSFLTEDQIDALPVGDRSINSLARLDPRIGYNRDPFDRAISVSGLSNRYNSIQIDGVSASDPFGLNANNTAAERNVVPLDSLEAVSINSSPYFARNAGFVGAQINAITKSGSNEFKGSLYYTYRDQEMVGDDIAGRIFPLADFKEQTLGATLGGPIIKNKLFFYASYEKVEEDRVPPSPATALPQATIDTILAGATALGFTPGSAAPPTSNTLDDDNILVKLDWEINPNHRATVRYNNVESSRPTFPGFGSGISENNISLSSAWYAQEVKNTTYIGQLISRWNDRLSTELSISQNEYHSEPKNSSRQPHVQIRNVPVPGSSNTSFVTFGTELSRHANILDVETKNGELYASYSLNDQHTLHGGVQYEKSDIYNLFVQNALGNYDFNSLTEFTNIVANNTGTINYRQFTFNQILPGVEPAARFDEANLGFFLADKWRPNPNLLVDLGVRVDTAILDTPVPFNQTFFNTFGIRNDYTYDGKKAVQPRVGFNWQTEVQGRRTIIRGGGGLFYGRTPRVWISNSYSNTGQNFRTWQAGTQVSGSPMAPIVSGNPDAQATTGTSPAQTVAFMDQGFKLPSRYKGSLAVEHELPWMGLKLSAEAEATQVRHDVFYRNINLQQTRVGPDGRVLYFNSYSGATASGTRLRSTTFTNRLIQLSNTGTGQTQSYTVSLERPRKADGWSWKASYVATNATEVLFGTSSVAASNWNNRTIFNTNEQEERTSELEIKHRWIAHITKDFKFFKDNRTQVSLFYEGRSGYPFSFVFTNDANGDSQTQNDLLYVPNRNGDALVRFATTADRDRFFAIVDKFGLREGQRQQAGNNHYPWVNQFDLSIKQDIKLPGWRHKVILGLDILNVGNLINGKWGVIRGSNQFFVKREGVASAAFDPALNQYVYSSVSSTLPSGQFNPSLGRGEPAATRWSALFSARYEF